MTASKIASEAERIRASVRRLAVLALQVKAFSDSIAQLDNLLHLEVAA